MTKARVVRDLFAHYLEERSLVALIKELRARGMTPRGGTWTKDSVLRILRNPVYVGQIRLGRELYAGAAACPTRPVSAESIESLVLERIRQQAPSMNRHEIQRALEMRIEGERAQVRAMRSQIPPKIAVLSREMDQLFNRIPDLKPAARALAEDRLEALAAERQEGETKLGACVRRESALGRELDVEWVNRALTNLDVLWERMTDQNRGKLIAALVARVVVDERRGEIAIVLLDEAEPVL